MHELKLSGPDLDMLSFFLPYTLRPPCRVYPEILQQAQVTLLHRILYRPSLRMFHKSALEEQ